MESAPAFDLSSQEFFTNPFPTLERMRRESPVYFHAPLGVWFLARYADCEAVIRDPARFTNQRAHELLSTLMPTLRGTPELEAMASQWSRLLWFLDPPKHTRSRNIVNRGFGAAALEHMRPLIRDVVKEAFEGIRDREEVDVAIDFADPIGINAICAMFGVPDADRPEFRRWTTDLMKAAGAGAGTSDSALSVKESSAQLFKYIGALVEERHKSPGQDMISRFLTHEGADPAVLEEVTYQAFQLIGAGYVTSSNQISNAVLSLLRCPDQLALLRSDPSLLRSAIEEILRWETSVPTTNRLCREDVEIGGKLITKGSLVFPLLASANRDPDVFPDPDRFDIQRKGVKHLVFSIGPHYCPGGALTRMELEEALRVLLTRPRWELVGPVKYGPMNFQDRGPESMIVRFSAG